MGITKFIMIDFIIINLEFTDFIILIIIFIIVKINEIIFFVGNYFSDLSV